MGFLTKLFSRPIKAEGPHPASDFWYENAPSYSRTGVNITPDSSLTISTVYACVAAIAQDVAAMPLIVYRRLPNGGKERARNHPLYEVLHDRPNSWMTAFDLWESLVAHALLRGNGYARIEPGPRGFADQLIPLHPGRMSVEQLPNFQLRYTYTWENGRQEIFPQQEILHIRGLGTDGICGLSVVALAREAMGLAKATEEYGARFFGQSAEPRGVLQLDGTLDQPSFERLRDSWQQAHGGLTGSNKVALLERGVKWQQVGLNNEDSQFLQSRNYQVEDVARWFKMPLQRIGHTEKQTTWGTGLEQFNIGYISYTLLPWLRRIEQYILQDLILAPQTFFAEFLMDHLLRGDTSARYSAYGMAIRDGWMSRNEVREKENLNPADGLDDYLVPQNMAVVDEDGKIVPMNQPEKQQPLPGPAQEQNREGEDTDQRAMLLATQLASIAVRREVTAVRKAARRFEGDTDGLKAWMEEFYSEHAGLIAKDLCISPDEAKSYCERQKKATEIDEAGKIRELTQLALGGIQ